ncbi:MAG: F0F1 ATP synthase subunit gamma [Bifidobacteriaceae bacterium]|nr:F0F1 ATP synthase subunit gamma [Bifidobacteriaceae bacterium]
MAGQQRVYRARIHSTQGLQKIFRAMEMIAASRISRARAKAEASWPYTRAMTRAVSAAAAHVGKDVHHPLLTERTDTADVAVLVVTADRGMCGGFNSTVIRAAEQRISELEATGHHAIRYVVGRRGASYYDFRDIPVEQAWTGHSDAPTPELAMEIADALLARFTAAAGEGGVAEIHIAYTHYKNMVSQVPQLIRMLPLEIVEGVAPAGQEPLPLYEFEPSTEAVLQALLPSYIRGRIGDCLLQSAASELAARQRAMHTATDNAEDLIRNYTRLANQARQAEITNEISEIVSGADALKGA